MHQPGAPPGLRANPAADRLVAHAGRYHQVRPGWLQRAGILQANTAQIAAAEQTGTEFAFAVTERLEFERPAQRLCQRQNLTALAGPIAGYQPYAACRIIRAGSRVGWGNDRSIHKSRLCVAGARGTTAQLQVQFSVLNLAACECRVNFPLTASGRPFFHA